MTTPNTPSPEWPICALCDKPIAPWHVSRKATFVVRRGVVAHVECVDARRGDDGESGGVEDRVEQSSMDLGGVA